MSSTFKISDYGLGQEQGGQGQLRESRRWETHPPPPQGPRGWSGTARERPLPLLCDPFHCVPKPPEDQARGAKGRRPVLPAPPGRGCG